jgi:hypothetical protein
LTRWFVKAIRLLDLLHRGRAVLKTQAGASAARDSSACYSSAAPLPIGLTRAKATRPWAIGPTDSPRLELLGHTA